MKTITLFVVVIVATFVSAVPSFSIDLEGIRYPKPPARPSIHSWPDGLAAAIADKTYLDGYNYKNPGYVIENTDTFYYGGDTEALNSFLKRLDKVKGLRVTITFSVAVGKVNRDVRAGTVRQMEALGLPLSKIDGQTCTWLVSVPPTDLVGQPKGGQIKTDARVLIFLGGKLIDVEKLRLPEWSK
jgi:hypothetical protein